MTTTFTYRERPIIFSAPMVRAILDAGQEPPRIRFAPSPTANVVFECPECGSMRGRNKFDVEL